MAEGVWPGVQGTGSMEVRWVGRVLVRRGAARIERARRKALRGARRACQEKNDGSFMRKATLVVACAVKRRGKGSEKRW